MKALKSSDGFYAVVLMADLAANHQTRRTQVSRSVASMATRAIATTTIPTVQGLNQRPSSACHQGHRPRDAPLCRHRVREWLMRGSHLKCRHGDRINAVPDAVRSTSARFCAALAHSLTLWRRHPASPNWRPKVLLHERLIRVSAPVRAIASEASTRSSSFHPALSRPAEAQPAPAILPRGPGALVAGMPRT